MKIESSREVTGSIQVKTSTTGKRFLYMVINTYDENDNFKQKWVSTRLEEHGNMKKAKAMLNDYLHKVNKELKEMEKDSKQERGKEILFHDWMKMYLAELKEHADIRNSTYEGYEYRIQHVLDYYEKKPITLEQVTIQEMETFFQYLRKHGSKKKTKGNVVTNGPLAVRTVRSIKSLVQSALDKAVAYGYIAMNPVEKVTISNKKNKDFQRKFNFMKVDELNKFIEFLESRNDEMTDIVKLIAHYGLRKSEALGITEKSLDLKNRKLYIERTIVKVKTIHDENDTKTPGSNQALPISDDMSLFFKRVLEKREENKKFYGNTYYDTPFLFCWEDGKSFSPNYLDRHLKKVAKEYGREGFTPHNLRHSAASNLYQMGFSEADIGEWLRHEDPSTTRKYYIALDEEHRKSISDKLNGTLKIN